MFSKERVGSRIRQVRTQQNKTLRDVESASGFSSTHISEIERGRTCPTIGALIQIASALEKDPSYFLENRELDEVFVAQRADRPLPTEEAFHLSGRGIILESLSVGSSGGVCRPSSFQLEPGAEGTIGEIPDTADVCFYAAEGSLELISSERVLTLAAGASLHGILDGPIQLRNPGRDPARILLVMDPGTVIP